MLAEPLCEPLRVRWCAERVGEDNVPVDLGVPGERAIDLLRLPVLAQRCDRVCVEHDGAS